MKKVVLWSIGIIVVIIVLGAIGMTTSSTQTHPVEGDHQIQKQSQWIDSFRLKAD
jgi:hypothetical protein